MNKIASIILFLAFSIGGIGGLLYLRHARWSSTRESTSNISPSLTQEDLDQEKEIQAISEMDKSRFVSELDVRLIGSIPKTFVELEAAHRQRSNDFCEALPAGEPIALGRWLSSLTPRDTKRKLPQELEFARREILTIALQIPEDDRSTLPLLSRDHILSFINENYLSLQLRLVHNRKTQRVYIHHRPIAVVAKYRSAGLSQSFVEPLGQTTKEIRGLGILRTDSDSESLEQVAVWLFRSSWQNRIESVPSIHHEFIFIHCSGVSDSLSPDRIPLNVVATSEGRTKFHHFRIRDSLANDLASAAQADMLGQIHFTQYASDGLHPKQSVTRGGEVRSQRTFLLSSVKEFLNKRGLHGDWQDHLNVVLSGMIQDEIHPDLEVH